MKKMIAILGLTLFTGFTAKAGILLDPYFNYITSGSADFISGASISGNELGARVGWEFLGFGVGVDSLLSGKYSYSQAGVTSDVTPTYIGAFASFKFPILFRAYISYLANFKEKLSAGDSYSGKATKIGFQYTGLPFLCIGLETFAGTYDTYTSVAGATSSISNKSSHTDLVLSMPFSF